MAVWIVRAGKYGEREEFALEHNVVVIGWDEVPDLRQFPTREALHAFYQEAHPEAKPASIASNVGQLWAFATKMEPGSLAVLPLKTRSTIAIGEVTGAYDFNPEYPPDARHIHPVSWIRPDLSRDSFDQDLRASFGALLTVSQVRREHAEERIRAKLGGSPLKPQIVPTAAVDGDVPEAETAPQDLNDYSRGQIQTYLSQRFVGHSMARLVDELLKAQGYQTWVSRPGPDGGVDILAGYGPLGFDVPKLVVQVKSGSQQAGINTVNQLQGVITSYGAQQGLLVSWGGFTEPARKEARRLFFSIRLWGVDELLTVLFEQYDKLPGDLQAEIPLQRIWALVPEE